MREDFRSTDHFYAANPERNRSREVDYGVMWTDGGLNFPHYRVSWVESTGEFYAVRLGPGKGGPVELLGYAEDDQAAEASMSGWAELDAMRLSWVRSRLPRMTPGRDFQSSLEGFRSMSDAEWNGLLMSMLRAGVLEPEEDRAFRIVLKERSKKKED